MLTSLILFSIIFIINGANGANGGNSFGATNSPDVSTQGDFHPLLASALSLPGVRLKIQPRGVSYLNQVAANILAQQIPRIVIPDVHHTLPSDQGFIQISNIRISRFRRAEIHNISTSAPNRLSWAMNNMDLGMIGDLAGAVNIVVPFNLTGQVEVIVNGLTFQMLSSIDRSYNGSALVSSLSCHTTIRSVEVINHNGGLFGLAVTVFKQGVSDNVRNLLQGLICKHVRKYVDEDLNEKLTEVQKKRKLSDAIQTNAIRASLAQSTNKQVALAGLLGKDFSKDFYIDFRLLEDPVCGDNWVELSSSGEISHLGEGGTPFGPSYMQWPIISDPSMMMLLISDHIPNSLFYQAYKQRLLTIHLTPQTEGVSTFLRTSCDGSFCIGDLIPQLGEQHPNTSVQLTVAATQAPAVLFSQKNKGVISISINGMVVMFIWTGVKWKQVAVIDMHVIADAKLHLSDQNITGTVDLSRFELVYRSGTIGLSSEDVGDVGLLVSQLVQNLINEMLHTGFPLPVPQVLRFEKIKIDVLSRRLLIRTDVAVDERAASRIASETLFNGPSFSDRNTAIVQQAWSTVAPLIQQRFAAPVPVIQRPPPLLPHPPFIRAWNANSRV